MQCPDQCTTHAKLLRDVVQFLIADVQSSGYQSVTIVRGSRQCCQETPAKMLILTWVQAAGQHFRRGHV